MNQLCILVAVFGVSSAAPNFPKVLTAFHPTIGERIVGGVEVDIKDVPYQVALLRNESQICGASLIGDGSMVLTAAHCVAESVIANISELSFRVGSTEWRTGGQLIFAKKIIVHEKYQDCDECTSDYDMAIVILKEKPNVTNAAVPIALAPQGHKYKKGTYAVVSGWGVTNTTENDAPETLRKVNVPVSDHKQCSKLYGSIITDRFICAGTINGGKDSCQGDSGGPFVINGELAGVVSFGYGCALPKFPGVYTSVPYFRKWIASHVNV